LTLTIPRFSVKSSRTIFPQKVAGGPLPMKKIRISPLFFRRFPGLTLTPAVPPLLRGRQERGIVEGNRPPFRGC